MNCKNAVNNYSKYMCTIIYSGYSDYFKCLANLRNIDLTYKIIVYLSPDSILSQPYSGFTRDRELVISIGLLVISLPSTVYNFLLYKV